jgi:hypothetical protein
VKRRRWWWLAAAVAVVAVPWWGPAVLGRFGFFAVRRIEVVGVRYLSPTAVVDALGLKADASVWTSRRVLERRVEALAGVDSATVSRRLPGTLRVEVVEEEPVALAAASGGLVPVGHDGSPLPYDPAAAPVDAPIVARVDGAVVAALAVVQATDPGLFAAIVTARAAGGGEVVLELGEGRLRLAAPVDAAAVRAVAAVWRDLAARGETWRELDCRYKGWVVVRGAHPARSAPRAARRKAA